jgi:endonuclease/exonuclease/phosphatase family metal-dependent hydrolase
VNAQVSIRLVIPVLAALLGGACGSATYTHEVASPAPSESPAAAATAVATPEPEALTELRVALINLLAPLPVDAESAAATTFEQRLAIVIEQLQAFRPDIVAFNEASWTKDTGWAAHELGKALKMDIQYVRANPWYPGQTKEQSDETVNLVGFEEGEVLLTRFAIKKAERYVLNPRTSEAGEGRAAMHVVVGVPGLGDIDVYVTHLTGGGERVRQAQASDLTRWVQKTRSGGPALVLGDLADPPESATPKVIVDAGFSDVAALAREPVVTCCREAIVGEQPPVAGRTEYILASGIAMETVDVFAQDPRPLADGTLVYASDHNGLRAVFALPPVAPP